MLEKQLLTLRKWQKGDNSCLLESAIISLETVMILFGDLDHKLTKYNLSATTTRKRPLQEERIEIIVPASFKSLVTAHAKTLGMSLNSWCQQSLVKYMDTYT
jgi:hypothetical protein